MAQTGEREGGAERILAGRYRLESPLGSGGMGDVWRAIRLADGRAVAIKVLREHHATDPVLVTRFMREARAARMVRHPNVVEVLEVGQTDDQRPFIVQELLQGDDLSRTLKEIGGTLRTDIAVDLMLPIAEAVASVHESGIVHRDLKPGNIFLARIDKKTTPKLLDFGISQLEDTSDASRITNTGVAVGTPAYMAPEQVMARRDLDTRVDVWALGVILYEIVAGQLPFAKGDTPGALYVQICTMDPRPLREIVADVPEDYERVVARCLQREREDRYPTARELANELAAVRAGGGLSKATNAVPLAIGSRTARAAPQEPREVSFEEGTVGAGASEHPTLELAASPSPRKFFVRAQPAQRAAAAGRAADAEAERRAAQSARTRALQLLLVLAGAALTGFAWSTPVPRPAIGAAAIVVGALAAWRAVAGGRASLGMLALAVACLAFGLVAGIDVWLQKDFPALSGAVVPYVAIAGPVAASLAAAGQMVAARRAGQGSIVAFSAVAILASLGGAAFALAVHFAGGGG